jgi:hypothetical protein
MLIPSLGVKKSYSARGKRLWTAKKTTYAIDRKRQMRARCKTSKGVKLTIVSPLVLETRGPQLLDRKWV